MIEAEENRPELDPRRFVRACPQHNAEVKPLLNGDGDSLWCAHGAHHVTTFKVVDRLKARTLMVVPEDPGAKRGVIDVNEKARRTRTAGSSAGDKAKFVDLAGNVLWIQLVHVERKSGQHYEVRWRHLSAGDEPVKTKGVSAVVEKEDEAIAGFESAVAADLAEKWNRTIATARNVVIRPIPAADNTPQAGHLMSQPPRRRARPRRVA